MKPSKRLVPDYFTNREGGNWLQYEGGGFTEKQLDNAVTGFLSRHSSVPFEEQIVLTARIEDTNYQVHSLIWGKLGRMGVDAYARWDAYNGWTTKL